MIHFLEGRVFLKVVVRNVLKVSSYEKEVPVADYCTKKRRALTSSNNL